METKERKERLNLLLAEIARSDSSEARQIKEWVALSAEDAKERLVEAPIEDFTRIQGEARFLERSTRQLNAASAMLRRQQGGMS